MRNVAHRIGIPSICRQVAAAVLLVGSLLIITGTAPAGAQVENPVSGVAQCQSDFTYRITWTLTNTEVAPLTIGSIGPGGLPMFRRVRRIPTRSP